MTGPSAEKDVPDGVIVEEEWGVLYGTSRTIRSHGIGYWGKRHAEQDAERVRHNATLPNTGQPGSAEVVHRTVKRYWSATEWTRDTSPGGGDR